jgi:hypothetical protein
MDALFSWPLISSLKITLPVQHLYIFADEWQLPCTHLDHIWLRGDAMAYLPLGSV